MTEQDKEQVATLRRKAYGDAMAALRKAHKAEFDDLNKAACEALGVEYVRRATPEEKAAMQVEALKAQYPHLFS